MENALSWWLDGTQAGARLGISVATAGDVNGDGYADAIVGAYLSDTTGVLNAGSAFVYHGSSAGLGRRASWTMAGSEDNGRFGIAVAMAGDVNGDGFADVLVGTSGEDSGTLLDAGRAYLYHGSAESGLEPTPSWSAAGDKAGANFGRAVGSAGDVNGDGYPDAIVGAYLYKAGSTAEGKAFVYYGNGGAGLSLNPRQRHGDNSGPVAHLGSANTNAIRVHALAQPLRAHADHAGGRGQAPGRAL